MTAAPSTTSDDQEFSERELAWIREHLTELRASVTDPSIAYWYMGSALAIGLAAQIVGYLMRPSTTSEPFGLIADLVYAFGLTLWTGVVVTVFVQVLPELKRRQIRRFLETYEGRLGDPVRPRDAGPRGGAGSSRQG
ncbi:MAG: hypothetical protein ABWZ82_01875 [Candidatus Limnocylindrales bacterium]